MAHDTGAKIKASQLQIDLTIAEQKVFALQSRLEVVADLMAKHGFIDDTPHSKYCFVNGSTVVAEYQHIDGMPSNNKRSR